MSSPRRWAVSAGPSTSGSSLTKFFHTYVDPMRTYRRAQTSTRSTQRNCVEEMEEIVRFAIWDPRAPYDSNLRLR